MQLLKEDARKSRSFQAPRADFGVTIGGDYEFERSASFPSLLILGSFKVDRTGKKTVAESTVGMLGEGITQGASV